MKWSPLSWTFDWGGGISTSFFIYNIQAAQKLQYLYRESEIYKFFWFGHEGQCTGELRQTVTFFLNFEVGIHIKFGFYAIVFSIWI